MYASEAKEMLKTAPKDQNKQCVVNPLLTQADFFKVVNDAIKDKPDDELLHTIMEKRVYQLCRTQRRPRY